MSDTVNLIVPAAPVTNLRVVSAATGSSVFVAATTPPAGGEGQVQLNVSSAFGAAAGFTYSSGSLVAGTDSVGSGNSSTTLGYDSQTLATYGQSIGAHHRNRGTAATCIGESNTIGPNAANAFAGGFNNTVNGLYSVALGVGVSANGDGATAFGLYTAASRYGQLAHCGGFNNVQGFNHVDLYAAITATTAVLLMGDGAEFDTISNTTGTLRAACMARSSDLSKRAYEVHEISYVNIAGTLTIDDDTIVAPASGKRFAAVSGWSLTISASTNKLRVSVNSGSDTVHASCALIFSELY